MLKGQHQMFAVCDVKTVNVVKYLLTTNPGVKFQIFKSQIPDFRESHMGFGICYLEFKQKPQLHKAYRGLFYHTPKLI